MDRLLQHRTFIILSASCQQARLKQEYSRKKKNEQVKYECVYKGRRGVLEHIFY